MAAFTYKAVTKDGKRVDGTVQAASRSEAMAAVRTGLWGSGGTAFSGPLPGSVGLWALPLERCLPGHR